jgi:hypothetical protein
VEEQKKPPAPIASAFLQKHGDEPSHCTSQVIVQSDFFISATANSAKQASIYFGVQSVTTPI